MQNERMIRVTGHGELRIKPDVVHLTLTLERTDADYADAVAAAEEAAKTAKEALLKAGVGEAEMRALSLRTQPRYETVTDENGVRTRKFTGYSAVRRMRAELGADPAVLGRVIAALANCGAAPETAAEYDLKDGESLREKLIALAVKDARRRAKTMAKAADVRLGAVLSMETGSSTPIVRAAALRMDGAELQPEEIVLTEDVRMIYAIE